MARVPASSLMSVVTPVASPPACLTSSTASLVSADVGDNHLGALLGKCVYVRSPDALGASCYNGYFVFQAHFPLSMLMVPGFTPPSPSAGISHMPPPFNLLTGYFRNQPRFERTNKVLH